MDNHAIYMGKSANRRGYCDADRDAHRASEHTDVSGVEHRWKWLEPATVTFVPNRMFDAQNASIPVTLCPIISV